MSTPTNTERLNYKRENRTRQIVIGGIVGAVIGFCAGFAGSVSWHNSHQKLADKRPIVQVPAANVVLSPDLLPDVMAAHKAREEAGKKAAEAKERRAAQLRAELAKLEGGTSN